MQRERGVNHLHQGFPLRCLLFVARPHAISAKPLFQVLEAMYGELEQRLRDDQPQIAMICPNEHRYLFQAQRRMVGLDTKHQPEQSPLGARQVQVEHGLDQRHDGRFLKRGLRTVRHY